MRVAYEKAGIILIYLREFQFMVSAPDDSSLLSDQDTNQFLLSVGNDPIYLIKLYNIHFSSLSNKYITSCVHWT